MNTQDGTAEPEDKTLLRRCIQKVATGPEYSKDLSFDEAYAATRVILENRADPVQSAIFFIALRMKRETNNENQGVLKAILETMEKVIAPVDHLVDVADPYDGYTRSVPMVPFVPAVLAACGVPSVLHGVESVGPKYGVTHHKVLSAAGLCVDLSVDAAVARIGEPDVGWAYIDQSVFCPDLYNLISLRTRIVKRPVLTTVEVMTCPVRARKQTHLFTGYVHKAYPPVYADLARFAGFDSAIIARGVEGGIIPSLKQPAKIFEYHDKQAETVVEATPMEIGIECDTRAVPIPNDLPAAKVQDDEIAVTVDVDALTEVTLDKGLRALGGAEGPGRDALVYAGAITLRHLKHYNSLSQAADVVRKKLDSGEALARFTATATG